LRTSVAISEALDPKSPPNPPPEMREFSAIWDTGATNSAISQKVVDACDLKPIGMVEVHYGDGTALSEVYLVNIGLPNNVAFQQVHVTKMAVITADVLVGMDIIASGDFAVTNKNGQTVLSFRYPSIECIDFVAQSRLQTAMMSESPAQVPQVGRNDPCPCGSGKKYKKCHGA